MGLFSYSFNLAKISSIFHVQNVLFLKCSFYCLNAVKTLTMRLNEQDKKTV